MTIDTSFGKALLLESAKNCKFAKIDFFPEIQLYGKNFAKLNCPKNDKLCHFKYAKNCAQFLIF